MHHVSVLMYKVGKYTDLWILSAMASQCKNGSDSVGTLCRVVLGEVAFCYDNVNIQQ